MKIAEIGLIPRVLDYLQEKGIITENQKNDVIQKSAHDPEYDGLFFGDVAVKLKYIDKKELDRTLGILAEKIAFAAKKDIEFIFLNDSGLVLPEHMVQPHFGNNGKINTKLKKITIAGGATDAANVAKLIVIIVLQNPKIIDKNIKDGVYAAADLAIAILHKDSKSLLECSLDWIQKSKNALRSASDKVGINEKMVHEYIENRFSEIQSAVDVILEPMGITNEYTAE